MRKKQYISEDNTKPAFVYKTTHTESGKVYIGVRTITGTSQDDTYLGSGKYIKAAIKKYSKCAFTREILFSGTQFECYEYERILVTKEFISKDSTYNICVGGWGGDRNCSDAISKAQKSIHENRTPEEKLIRSQWLEKIRDPSTVVRGDAHPKHIGYWHTPKGVFTTIREAAAVNQIDHGWLRRICKDCDAIISKSKKYQKDTTWRENGFWFEEKILSGGAKCLNN